MKNILLILLLCLSTSSIFAQDDLQSSNKSKEPSSFLEVPIGIKTRIDNFFNQIINGNVKSAYSNLLVNSPISKQKIDLDNLLSQTSRAFEIYGKLSGYEAVNAEIATNSYLRLRYLGLHGNFPVRWIFTFYRSPEKDWIVTNIKFDDLSEYFFKGD